MEMAAERRGGDLLSGRRIAKQIRTRYYFLHAGQAFDILYLPLEAVGADIFPDAFGSGLKKFRRPGR